jgi:hypothetical protein
VLANIESETDYIEAWFLRKTEKVKEDIKRCWELLKRDLEEKEVVSVVSDLSDAKLVKQLKATFKFYHPCKLQKNILSLESTLHRISLTKDNKFVYAGGNGCKLRKKDLSNNSNNVYTDKSRAR